MHNTLFDRIGILGVRANPHVLNKPICHTMPVPIILEAVDVVGCTDAKSGRQEWIWKHDVVVGQFNNAKRGAILTLFTLQITVLTFSSKLQKTQLPLNN